MDINSILAGQLVLIVVTVNLVTTALTWQVGKRKVDSPGLLACCNAALGFLPPMNILVLTVLAMLPRRPD